MTITNALQSAASQVVTHAPINSLIEARNDQEAIEAFLERRSTSGKPTFSKNTYESYRRYSFLLLHFCHEMLGKGLGEINLSDVQAFAAYIAFPPPDKVGHAKRPFGTEGWKPFVVRKGWQPGDRALSEASVNRTIGGLKSLYSWLQKTGYIQLNPFGLLDTNTAERKLEEAKSKSRVLQVPELKLIAQWLEKNEHNAKESEELSKIRDAQRKRWLFYAYLTSGLRLSELIRNDTQSLQQEYIQGSPFWILNIIGKGNKPAQIPVAKKFISEFYRYREGLDKPMQPNPLIGESFFFSLSGSKPITSRQSLHEAFKSMMNSVADDLIIIGRQADAVKIQVASTHWLRHSFVSIGVDQTQDIAAMSELARHSDIKTTIGYNKVELVKLSTVMDTIADMI